MPKYQVRDADSYGHAIGILLLDYRGPFIPGDVGNASTYRYPVLYKLVKGLTFDKVLSADPDAEEMVVDAARELERSGVRGISSDCGFLVAHQAAVAKAVKPPVFMSSLLQIPYLAMMFDPERPIGCITATRSPSSNSLLDMAGVAADTNVVLRGMENYEHFKWAILEEGGELDSDLIEREVVAEAKDMVAQHPDMSAMVLECSLLPPYAKAVQDAIGLPVFDFITMIDYFYQGSHRRTYEGFY
jgi:hypothetical protein